MGQIRDRMQQDLERGGYATRTVESYRVQIMDKMKAPSVAVLVRFAIRLGRLAP